MAKKSSQFPQNRGASQPQKSSTSAQVNNNKLSEVSTSSASSNQGSNSAKQPTMPNATQNSVRVQPEQMSLDAHAHIQALLKKVDETSLSKDYLAAVLRLSQHLRVFGLLSAVGYINQPKSEETKVSKNTTFVWKSLINQLIAPNVDLSPKALMEKVRATCEDNPTEYMRDWRKSLQISNHWNFWARAYSDN